MTGLLAKAVEFALITWLVLLALVIALGILRGDIPLNGLLSTGGSGIDPERVQSLAVVAIVFGGYLMEVVGAPSGARTLPEVPESLLLLLAGSNGLYLSGKVARTV